MIYQEFAGIYDHLMAEVDYRAWAQYYLQLARRAGSAGLRVVDCACGTGNMTLALARLGVRVTGMDRSADMLRIAGQKARSLGLQVPFVCQDMCALSVHRPQDAVFCACDGVNYLTSETEALAFFRAAYGAVRPGGCLVFDVSTEYKLAHVLGDRCLGNDDAQATYLWQNHYDPEQRMIQMDMTFFRREEDGRYTRFVETHMQRAHTIDELNAWLRCAGFEDVRCYGDQTFAPPQEDAERMHVVAIRPE